MAVEGVKRVLPQLVAPCIPVPQADANKYSRGCLAIIGGSAAYPGAACLAACAAQRMGAGYTQVWCAPESVDAVRFGHPSLVVRPWDDPQRAASLEKRSMGVLIGCGFEGNAEWEYQLLAETLGLFYPTVVDGGGLSALAEYVNKNGFGLLKEREEQNIPLVLTPHAGEAARLAAAAKLEAADQAEMAQKLAQAYSATVVLKGPQTVIYGQGECHLMTQGTAALAKAGTGDVLAGIIGALLAQGVSPVQAGCLGSSLHAHAGYVAAEELTAVSVIPEDVIAALPRALKDYLALRGQALV